MRSKYLSRKVATAIVAGLTVLSVAACSSPGTPLSTTDSGATDKQYTIGILVPQENQGAYGAAYSTNIKKKAELLGVEVVILNSDYTAATQQSQMQQLIAKKVDAIVLWPAVFGTTSTMLLAAKKAGIPVNISNSVVSADEADLYHTFTGPSDTRIGENQADIVGKMLSGSGNVIIIEGQPGNTAATGRLNGFTDQISRSYPGITILGSQPGNWQQQMAQTATSNLLTRFGVDVDVVVTADDVMAAGAAQAIAIAGLTGKVLLVGSGYYEVTPPLMESGEQSATLFQSPCWDAVYALDKIVAVLNGENVDKEYLMPVPEVTKDNMGEYTPMGCLPGDEL